MSYTSEIPLINIAFNSLSAASTSPLDVLIRERGTRSLGERIVSLQSTLGKIFGKESVSVSLLPGRNVDLSILESILREKEISIHSVDIPDVKHLSTAMLQATGNVLVGNRQQAERHIGWAFSNVGSRREQRLRTREGLEMISPHSRRVIKANAAFWNDQRQGQELIDELKRTGETTIMAVEIDADTQTQSQYLTFMDRLKTANLGNIIPCYDLDIGHLERSTFYHKNSGNKPVNALLEKIFTEPQLAREVAIVSLNQYRQGAPESHARLDRGDIDLVESTRLLGESIRRGNLPFDVTLLLETLPSDYDWYSDTNNDGGVIFFHRIKKALTHAV